MKYILSIKEYLARKEELKSRYGFEVCPMPDIDMDINFQNKNGIINIKRREYHRFIHFDKSFKLHINEEEMSSNSRINFKISSFGSGNIIENDSELYGERLNRPKYFDLPSRYILAIYFENKIPISIIDVIIDSESSKNR